MDVLEAVRTRRSLREFSDQDIPAEKLQELMEALIWTPTGSNAQETNYILVRAPEQITRIKKFAAGLFGWPKALVVIASDRKQALEKGGPLALGRMGHINVGIAAAHVLLLAHGLGIGTCPCISFNQKAVQYFLGLPDHIEPLLIINLGYRRGEVLPSLRRLPKEVMHFDRYGNPL